MGRWTAPGLLALALLVPSAAVATTATSLSNRIVIDGSLDDFSADEWVLDPSSPFPEPAGDSRWGPDADVTRVAVTWDASTVYVAVECRLVDASVLVLAGEAAGGLRTLDIAGEFQRAITMPFGANVLALATPGGAPRVARADAQHSFGRVDRAVVPAVAASDLNRHAAFELAIPWSMLAPRKPLRILVAITGDTGTGVGDAAPDPRAALSVDRTARAVLDRWIEFDADADGDGTPDAGVSPRTAAVIQTGAEAVVEPGHAGLDVSVTPKRFAPDAGESVTFTATTGAVPFDQVEGRCTILAMDGRTVRSVVVPAATGIATVQVTWDGRDDAGRVVDGGIYVAAFDLEFTAGGTRQRSQKNAGVAVVR